jgi:F-type H+-transporting ATPase subunit a
MFRVFEPQSWARIRFNWLIVPIVLLVLPCKFWLTKNDNLFVVRKTLSTLVENLRSNVSKFFSPGGLLIYVSFLLFISARNFLGLIPYIFTSTRHLVMTLRMALPLWIGHVAYSWLKNPNHMFAHLVPTGTPGALMSFIVLIELIRRVIRPITLSVRLAANIIAGHLLLTLVSSAISLSPLLILIILGVISLAVLESAVAIIQAYVFSILSVLYVEEVTSIKLN